MEKELLIQSLTTQVPELLDEPGQLEKIAACFCLYQMDAGDFFVRQGRPSEDYLLLSSGSLRAFTLNPAGEEVTTRFFRTGSVVFEPGAFFMHLLAKESIQALVPSCGFCLKFPDLNELFHSLPLFREFGRRMLVKEFIQFREQTLASIGLTAEQRYLKLLEEHPEIFQDAPLKQIASFLGITDTSLSRIRRDLTRK